MQCKVMRNAMYFVMDLGGLFILQLLHISKSFLSSVLIQAWISVPRTYIYDEFHCSLGDLLLGEASSMASSILIFELYGKDVFQSLKSVPWVFLRFKCLILVLRLSKGSLCLGLSTTLACVLFTSSVDEAMSNYAAGAICPFLP